MSIQPFILLYFRQIYIVASIMPKGLYQLLLKGLYFLIDANLMVINQYCATKIFLTGTGLKPMGLKNNLLRKI